MKLRNIALTIGVVTLPLVFLVSAQAQSGGVKATRVNFKKGSSTATFAGGFTNRAKPYALYVLSAMKGQSVKIHVVKVSGPGIPSIEIGAVPRETTDAEVQNEFSPIYRDRNLTQYTYVVDSNRDTAIWVNGKFGAKYKLTIEIPLAKGSTSKARAPQKTKQVPRKAKREDLKLDDGVLKHVELAPVGSSVTVSGTTVDWEKKTTTYFDVDLRKGQNLLISADPADISIETYTGFEPYEGSRGQHLLEAHSTTGYQIVARSKTPGKRYTLTFKLQ